MAAHLVMPGGQADDAFLQDVTQRLHDRFDIDHVTLQAVRLAFTAPRALLDPCAFPGDACCAVANRRRTASSTD